MIKSVYLTCLSLFLFCSSGLAQTTNKGLVKDQADSLLLGNALLLSNNHLSLIKDAYFETISASFLANDVLQKYRKSSTNQIEQSFIEYSRRLNTNFNRLSVVHYIGKLRNTNYKKHSGEYNNAMGS